MPVAWRSVGLFPVVVLAYSFYFVSGRVGNPAQLLIPESTAPDIDGLISCDFVRFSIIAPCPGCEPKTVRFFPPGYLRLWYGHHSSRGSVSERTQSEGHDCYQRPLPDQIAARPLCGDCMWSCDGSVSVGGPHGGSLRYGRS